MIHQLNIYGKDMVEEAIEKIQGFSQIFKDDNGYFIAFSGGKDSVVIKALADMAGVKYEAHYRLTSVDPPELVRFIKEQYPDVIIDKPRYKKDGVFVKAEQQITMWNLIPEKRMPPTRIARYCCQYLKETAGDGRITMTGVRWAESVNRKKNQGLVTVYGKNKQIKQTADDIGATYKETMRGGIVLTEDNEESRELVEFCYKRQKTVLNPIIEWSDADVWEFIHEYNVPYCKLYDEGYKRLGCVGCPMSTHAAEELEKYPKYKQAYLKAFEKMLDGNRSAGIEMTWNTPQQVMQWWLSQM